MLDFYFTLEHNSDIKYNGGGGLRVLFYIYLYIPQYKSKI